MVLALCLQLTSRNISAPIRRALRFDLYSAHSACLRRIHTNLNNPLILVGLHDLDLQ
jgi:hypothetical protein